MAEKQTNRVTAFSDKKALSKELLFLALNH
jgi:hypothetical protein